VFVDSDVYRFIQGLGLYSLSLRLQALNGFYGHRSRRDKKPVRNRISLNFCFARINHIRP
jgi:hypothetical protein